MGTDKIHLVAMIKLIIILQIICILAIGVGIYVEYTLQADTGYLLITGGTLVWALSVKLTKIRLLRVIKYLTKQMEDHKND